MLKRTMVVLACVAVVALLVAILVPGLVAG